MSDEIPTQPAAANPLVALLGGGMSNPYVLLAAMLVGSGTVTFGVQQATAPELVASKAEVAALSVKVDTLLGVVNKLAGSVETYHKNDKSDSDED